ncbi:MAG: hypothetical protein K6F04_02705 [bacterium]|nr:hypothetical protein [bacterium]
MKKVLEENSNKFMVSTFRSNHPFIVVGKSDFDKITKIIEKYRHTSKYTEALMNRKEKVLLEVADGMEEFAGFYSDGLIFINREDFKNEKQFFQYLVHEYTHYLQDITLEQFDYSTRERAKRDPKNTVQDFYICMICEADAYTKEALIYNKNITSKDMNEMFFNQIKYLATKINCERYYHDYFHYIKMKMNAEFTHPKFKLLLKSFLSSGTTLQDGAFPMYTFTFDELSKFLDETIIENKQFEMLAKVNHWSEDETRFKILNDANDCRNNKYEEWKSRLNNFCILAKDKKLMKKLLSDIKIKEL